MKKELLKPMLVLTGALGSVLLTGCAASNQNLSQATTPALSALAFVPVTDPQAMVKWSNDWRLMHNLRSIDTYYFQVPETETLGPENRAMTVSGYPEGAGAPGAYQVSSGGSALVPYRPGDSH